MVASGCGVSLSRRRRAHGPVQLTSRPGRASGPADPEFRDFRPCANRTSRVLDAKVFVGHEVLLDVGFAVARQRLAQLAAGGVLADPSADAYEHETVGLARVGAAGFSKLVRVQVRELAWTDKSARLAIPSEATRPAGAPFPL